MIRLLFLVYFLFRFGGKTWLSINIFDMFTWVELTFSGFKLSISVSFGLLHVSLENSKIIRKLSSREIQFS